ncbi:MAG: FAD-dependent oxidoreductase, partial [Halobacteriaceae archaeon]
QVLGWFQPRSTREFSPDEFPVFVHETDDEHFYGFPRIDVPGVKLGKFHHLRESIDPNEMAREPTPEDERVLRSYVEEFFPNATGPTMRLKTCIFTNTPDEHFLVDVHPERPGVIIGGGFSGHGFKFASVLGEILAQLAGEGETRHDIDLFSADRD